MWEKIKERDAGSDAHTKKYNQTKGEGAERKK